MLPPAVGQMTFKSHSIQMTWHGIWCCDCRRHGDCLECQFVTVQHKEFVTGMGQHVGTVICGKHPRTASTPIFVPSSGNWKPGFNEQLLKRESKSCQSWLEIRGDSPKESKVYSAVDLCLSLLGWKFLSGLYWNLLAVIGAMLEAITSSAVLFPNWFREMVSATTDLETLKGWQKWRTTSDHLRYNYSIDIPHVLPSNTHRHLLSPIPSPSSRTRAGAASNLLRDRSKIRQESGVSEHGYSSRDPSKRPLSTISTSGTQHSPPGFWGIYYICYDSILFNDMTVPFMPTDIGYGAWDFYSRRNIPIISLAHEHRATVDVLACKLIIRNKYTTNYAYMGHIPTAMHIQANTVQINTQKCSSYWLVIPTPLKNMSSSLGMMTFPTEWTNNPFMYPNHQAVLKTYGYVWKWGIPPIIAI